MVVGKLQDPYGNPSATWCIEEKGTRLDPIHLALNRRGRAELDFRFDDKFWLVSLGGRYAITDANISNQEIAG